MDDSIVSDLQGSREERHKPEADAILQELDAMSAQQEAPQASPTARPSAAPQVAPTEQPQGTTLGEAAMDTGRALLGAPRDAIQSGIDMYYDGVNYASEKFFDYRFNTPQLPEVGAQTTTGGAIARPLLQFFVPFSLALKALKPIKGVSELSKAATAGAVTDFSAFDPHEKRLSNLVLDMTDGNPLLGKGVFQYLAASPDDSNAEGRFKNMLEGLGAGAAVDGALKLFKGARGYFQAKGQNPAEAIETIGRGATPEGAPVEQSIGEQIDEIHGVKPEEGKDVVKVGGERSAADMDAEDAIAAEMQAKADAEDALPPSAVVQPEEAPNVTIEGDAETIDSLAEAFPDAARVEQPQAEVAALDIKDPETTIKTYDPVADKLSRPEFASIAPITRKASPKISQAKVTEIMDAAGNGSLKDIADKVETSDFNFAHIDNDEDITSLIDATSKVFEKEISQATGGTQSFAAIKELAETLGTSTSSLKELYGDTSNLAARVTANRVLLAASAKKTSELARDASTGDAMSLLAFRKQVMLHSSIQSQMKGVQTEVARALGAMRIQAKSSDLVINEVDDLLSSLGGRQVNLDFAKKLATTTDPAKIAAMARKGAMARTQNAVFEMWVNGILSAPTTHVVNAVGNSLVSLMSVAERGTTAAIGKVFRGGADDRVALGEVQAQLFGMVEGLKDVFSITGEGLKAMRQATGEAVTGNLAGAKDILKTNEGEFGNVYQAFVHDTPILDNALFGTKEFDLQTPAISADGLGIDVKSWTGTLADVLGTLIRTPGRVLTSTDEVFKAIHYRGELKAQAYRLAKGEGLEGQEFIDRVGNLVSEREMPINGDVLSGMAMDAARKGTFTNSLGDGGKTVQRLVSNVPGARYVLPFIRTPANIMNYTWERTPMLNILNSQMREDFMAGGVRRDTAMAKTTIGGALYAMAAQLSAEGAITGGGESNKTAEQLNGWKPYSLKVGDTYYAFNKLDPIGMIFGLAADFSDMSGNISKGDTDKLAGALIMAVSNNLLSKSYLSSVSDIFTAISEDKRTGEGKAVGRYLNKLTASFVPFSSLNRAIRREDDPTVREVWDLMDNVKNGIPGLSKTLSPHRNVFGDPVQYTGGLGLDIASPIYTSKESDNPAANEIARLNIDLQLPAKTISSGKGAPPIDLTHEQYDRFVELAGNGSKIFQGKGFKDFLTEYVQSEHYQNQTDDPDDYTGGKRLEIQSLYSAAKRAALYQMLEENPELNKRYIQNLENTGNALKGRPIVPILIEQ
ncbi:hypothetical protein A7981_05705 [Methylovorus sp. MM2]|uniref:hypothetical protein n=1 Tax=Methylovorus sp. MM2 TaxID=1848038 RepID=UPI0007DF14E8|nr:hypothetical protein [Methylovorus sp. MM2]OAM52928.1 hypothetical protein A7981_05705 [Methylovorus sp. MM2]